MPQADDKPGAQTLRGGPMNPIAGSNVAGIIDVNPTHGVYGTRVRITVELTSGADQVARIRVYSFSAASNWSVPHMESHYAPYKRDSSTWVQTNLLYSDSRAYILRFYAYAKDGRVLAVGDIAKNGGGPAVGSGNDGIGGYRPFQPGKLTI
jgi:hypothetical protein